tara:strand:- start:3313 stop:4431 length:1119 start_codon:yes stop_codon:yes gene_type:complete
MERDEFCLEEICLSSDGQNSIIEEWNSNKENPPSLKKLVQVGFPEIPEELQDGRSKYGKCIKAFLSSVNISAKKAHESKSKDIVLTEEHKEFIVNNVGTMRGHEMARVLFEDHKLNNLSSEARVVNDYIATLPSQVSVFEPESNEEIVEYKPPKTFDKTLARINKFVLDGVDKNNIPASTKKGINALIGYMHTYRFLHIINGYDSFTDRELYESSFIRYTYDKPDLTQEEVDQYIVLSAEVVISSNIQRRVEHLQALLDQNADQTDGARISMALVESINTAQNEYNQCVNRQQKLLNDLKEKRSDRLKNQIKENASILNLVQLWKEEESRKKLIELAERKKQVISEEVDKFEDMDDVKCRIMGLSKDEAVNG